MPLPPHKPAAGAFLAAHTRIQAPPLVPELRLHLADVLTPLWESTEIELERSGMPPPFWAFAWAGGQALARLILDHPALVRGRTVLDFASGSGLVGLAAARAGARGVLCADIDPFAAGAIAANGALNGLAVECTTEDLLGRLDLDAEVVLAGDICYEAPLAARVEAWLRALAREGREVLLGDPGRDFAPRGDLEELAAYDVTTTLEIESSTVRRATVWRVLA